MTTDLTYEDAFNALYSYRLPSTDMPPMKEATDDSCPGRQLSKREQEELLDSLKTIFQNAVEAADEDGDGDAQEVQGSESSKSAGNAKKIKALEEIKKILDRLWFPTSEVMIRAAEVLANGSRAPEWRRPLGQSGVLEFFCQVVATPGVRSEITLQSLRLVGNSCADTDENRQRVVDHNNLKPIIQCLRNPSLVEIAVPVVYNICLDHDSAAQQAGSAGLGAIILETISDQNIPRTGALFDTTCRLLELVSSYTECRDASPENAAELLFKAAGEPEVELDDFLALVGSATAYLQDVRSQKSLVKARSVEFPLSILVDSYSRFSSEERQSIQTSSESTENETSQEKEDQKLLSQMRGNLIEALSEVSALDEFAKAYPLDSRLIGSLRLWLSVPQAQLKVCACIMLGNLARSDEVCREMVQLYKVHVPLTSNIRESSEGSVMHAAAGFLKNLSLLQENKATLADAGLIEACSRLWKMDTNPQIQYAGASLARQLISKSYDAIQHLLVSLSQDPDSPAYSRTYLSLLLSLFETSDQTPTKTEVARTIAAICRVLNSTNDSGTAREQLEETNHRLYSLHPNVGHPISVMVCQDKWPIVRSEGWFAYALMARTEEGASVVNECLRSTLVLSSLLKTVSRTASTTNDDTERVPSPPDQPAPNQPANIDATVDMQEKDVENILVLVSELSKWLGERMGPARRQFFDDILRKGKSFAGSFSELLEQVTAVEEANGDHYIMSTTT
ncbi:MAG: hypothetical protein M1819_003781 [Sarea resinae]|nr:MAG: hypothetical protein M1819_003781 [Sarea resinae]